MATANKNLKFFMRPQQEIDKINAIYRKRSIATDKKGNPLVNGGEVVWKTERDNARALRHIIVAALQYPKLDDKELMSYYKCVDVTDMPLHVFSHHGEYDYVVQRVMQALGMMEAPDDAQTLEEAKN